MRIFDIVVGLPGSVHDASAWKMSAIYRNNEAYLAPGEWIWADSAYPISDWVVAPYKMYVLLFYSFRILTQLH